MINRIDLYGLFTDVLILDNPYRGKFSRIANGYFGHRSPYVVMQVYYVTDHASILRKERDSIDDVWPPICKLEVPKNV